MGNIMINSTTVANPHLIYSYFVEMTGMREVFKALFKSFLICDEDIKLNQTIDNALITDIDTTINLVFPKPVSSISPTFDELRYNAYWRLFGYTIKGTENFPKVNSYNPEFNKTLEDIFYNIAQGILDQGITSERLSNPDALSMLLNDLQRQLINRTYNGVEYVAAYWYGAFTALRNLLNNNQLMVARLGIRANQEDRRLIELGEKLKVPVAKESMYLFELAERMSVFLRKVEETVPWDSTKSTELFTNPDYITFFKEIFNDWFKVTGKDFLAEALKARRKTS